MALFLLFKFFEDDEPIFGHINECDNPSVDCLNDVTVMLVP